MTTAMLRVPRQPQAASPNKWQQLIGTPAGTFIGFTPNAAYYNGKTYFAYTDQNGSVYAASYNHTTHAVTVSSAIITGLASDWHDSPTLLVRSSDHKLVLAVCRHNADNHMYVAISTNAEDVSAWGAATDIGTTLAGASYTYASLFQLSGESGTIYLFYRTQPSAGTYTWSYSTSTDGGATWAAQTTFWGAGATQNYMSIDSDGVSRIDVGATDGTRANGDTSSAYHFYYTGGNWYKTDGTLIGGSGSLPLAPANVTKIYDGATNGYTTSIGAVDPNGGSPVITFAAYNSAGAGSNLNYWYAIYTGGSWSVNSPADTGYLPTDFVTEGSAPIDRLDPSTIYLTRKVSGAAQLYAYTTSDHGSTWATKQITFDVDASQWNMHAVCPRDEAAGLKCLWMSGGVNTWGTSPAFVGQIRGYPNPVGAF